MNTESDTDSKEQAKLYSDAGLKLASELDKAVLALDLAIFGGAAVLLNSPGTCEIDGGSFLLSMLCAAVSAGLAVAHLNLSSKLLIGSAAALKGTPLLNAPGIAPVDAKAALARLTRDSQLAYGFSIRWLTYAVATGGVGIVVHHWTRITGAGTAVLLWIAIALAFTAGLLSGMWLMGRRCISNNRRDQDNEPHP